MSYYDNGFARAQQLYDQQEPDYPDYPECPFCTDGEFKEIEKGVWGCTCGAVYYDAIPDAPDHEMKIWPEYFQAVATGRKTFEVRGKDWEIKVGERVQLREWDPHKREYTGRELMVNVTYLLDGPLAPQDLVIFGIEIDYGWC